MAALQEKQTVPSRLPAAVVATPGDWLPANPWLWLSLGLLLTGLAFGWARLFDANLSAVRYFFLVSGLLCGAAGLAIRLQSGRPALARLPRATQQMLPATLFLIYPLMALVMTLLVLALVLEAWGLAWWPSGGLAGWKLGGAVVVWFIVTPMSLVATQSIILRLKRGEPLSVAEENAVALMLCGLVLFLSCWALYLPSQPEEWDTIRLVFAVFSAVALIASVLPMLPLNARRTVISGLILLHFSGICTAVLTAPPYAWVSGQVWTRIYRPYLEFMYLNNAYHFYSPEPGPASHVWFALTYTYKEKDGKEYDRVHWVKIPDVDENGNPRYIAGLTYQRYLSFTENVSHSDAMPPTQVFNKHGQMVNADFFQRRLDHSYVRPVVVGKPDPSRGLIVPFANIVETPLAQQYAAPATQVRRRLESYARHACRMSIPDLPDDKVIERRVKIYRVTHDVPNPQRFSRGSDPQDPRLYRPYFLGEYDKDGNLIDPEEPFLYWLLPNLAEQPDQFDSPIISFVRKHARDPLCKYLPETKQWVEETPNEK